MNAKQIQECLDRLEKNGHRIGPRAGMLTSIDGVWRDDRWLHRNAREASEHEDICGGLGCHND